MTQRPQARRGFPGSWGQGTSRTGVSAMHWEAHLGMCPIRGGRPPHWVLQHHLEREAAEMGDKQSPL